MATLQSAVQFTESQCRQVRAHLNDLLESAPFGGSRRRQAFLRYVVEEALAGRGEGIKETNIAVDVFERTSDFDTKSESIVRVTGGEVRKRLAQAYASGLEHDIRIELPVGSYHPFFHFLPVPSAPQVQDFAPKSAPRRAWILWAAMAFAAALAVLTLSGAWKSKSPLDRLWQPFVGHDQVLLSLMDPTLLVVADQQKWLPLRPGGLVPTSELIEMESAFVGTGGALAAALFSQQLTARDQPFSIKFGNDLSFADLKNSPAVLVGASRWTRELTQGLRFRMLTSSEGLAIYDAEHADRSWAIPSGRRRDRSEGYSLITRLTHSEAGQPILVVEGIDSRNTQAAVEFLARSDKFDPFAALLPKGWETKNFQVVLHSTIHGSSPGSLNVAAFKTW